MTVADRREYSKKYRERNFSWLSLRGRQYYRKNKAQLDAKHNRRYQELKIWLAEYKVQVGCVDCGYKDNPAALEFDHIDGHKPKKGGLTLMSLKSAMEEIKKCEVRCSNCHSIRHFNSRLESK